MFRISILCQTIKSCLASTIRRQLGCSYRTVGKPVSSSRIEAHSFPRSAFFGLFASGMAMTSSYFAFTNLSTVENLARRTRTYNLAVLLPPTNIPPPTTTSYRTITYPLAATPEEQLHAPRPGQRTFAILSVRQGQNPYSLSPFENFKQVLGNRLWDWFLPIRLSPCCAHGRGDAEGGSVSSMYPMGSVFEKVKADAGLPTSGPVGEKAGEVIE